jgi:heme oxygenase
VTATRPDLATAPLSVAMRAGSHAEHQAAERSPFVARLLDGRVSEAGYVALLERLHPVYAALEEAGRAVAGHPVAAAVHDPVLERLAALEDDLAFWSGGEPAPVSSPAAAAYVDRLEASTGWPGLFVAHHYTRYLGDLSGGQAFAATLRREFGATSRGTAFYSFAIPRPKLYKDAYRARLDALDLGAQEQRRIVAEVRVAFRLNQQLFAELGEHLDTWNRVPQD